MTTFDKREEAFEQQFAHDEELKFKATARRNKLLGLWAAEKLGLSGAEADSYALSVVMSDLEDTSEHDVAHKIRKDFDAKGVAQSDHQIAAHDDRIDGAGHRRHQSRPIGEVRQRQSQKNCRHRETFMAIANFTLARPPARRRDGLFRLVRPALSARRRNAGARRISRGDDRKPARPVGRRRHPQRHRRGPPGRRGADRARAAQRFRAGEPRARLRRRRHHRADDQYAGRCARLCRGGQVPAGRRAQLGPAPRHDASRGVSDHVDLSARSQRSRRHARHDRDAHGAAKFRRDHRHAGHRRLLPRPVRPVDRAVGRQEPSIRCRRKSTAISTP